MREFPDLVAPWNKLPLVHNVTELFPEPTMDALDARYGVAGGGDVATGGTAGQVYTKQSGTDFDADWEDASAAPDASTTVKGIVELATSGETTTGTDTVRAVTPAGLADVAALKVDKIQAINAQTGTTYTIVLGDDGKLVTLNNASPVTVTLPQDSSVAIPVGGRVDFAGIGVGLVTFAAGSGATVNGTPSLVTRARYSAASAIKIAANTWLLVGDLA